MGKKLPTTPKSRVRAALRQVWLRSRERQAAIKRDNNTCQVCGKKGSAAKGKEVKIECHHHNTVTNWQRILDVIYQELLCDPKHLTTLCVECHKKVHEEGEM